MTFSPLIIWAKALFFFEQLFPVVARTWLVTKSDRLFLGPKFRFLAKKSDFCHTTPILVDDPFLALGMTVNFTPWEQFFDFPFRSYSSFHKNCCCFFCDNWKGKVVTIYALFLGKIVLGKYILKNHLTSSVSVMDLRTGSAAIGHLLLSEHTWSHFSQVLGYWHNLCPTNVTETTITITIHNVAK